MDRRAGCRIEGRREIRLLCDAASASDLVETRMAWVDPLQRGNRWSLGHWKLSSQDRPFDHRSASGRRQFNARRPGQQKSLLEFARVVAAEYRRVFRDALAGQIRA